MSEPIPNLLVVASFETGQNGDVTTITKACISSLMRSIFSGRMVVFSNRQTPLFKVERKAVDEVFVPMVQRPDSVKSDVTGEFLLTLCQYVSPEPGQWVIIADAASLALRNIDHLVPPDVPGPYAPPQVDFYWMRAESLNGESRVESASPGLWAVRGEHLQMVLERWRIARNETRDGNGEKEEEIWTRVVRELPLRKKAFEKGEVVAPRMGTVDWEAVSNAALVTVPDWTEPGARKFLQALYFGTYLGDETGMILNILEA